MKRTGNQYVRTWTRAIVIGLLREYAAKTGHTPRSIDIRKSAAWDGPKIRTVFTLFGSLRNAQRAAGLKVNSCGGQTVAPRMECKNGHKLTADNIYTIQRRGYVTRRCKICTKAANNIALRRMRERRAVEGRQRLTSTHSPEALAAYWGVPLAPQERSA